MKDQLINITDDQVLNASSELSPVGSSEWIDECYLKMRDLSDAGREFSADDFIRQLKSPDDDQILDLAYAEILLKNDRGESVSVETLRQRFPTVADRLIRQLDFDQVISGISFEQVTASQNSTDSAQQSIGDRLQKWVPESIGRYRVIQAFSGGGQADIFRAYDPELRRDVIVKVHRLHEDGRPSPPAEAEAAISASLNHPNLATALDAGKHDGRPYWVCRFIEGLTFDQWIRHANPSIEMIAEMISTLSLALDCAHKAGILHLDVKPDNILMTQDGQPVLIDFGLATVNNHLQQVPCEPGVVRGTWEYMSPEQIRGDIHNAGPTTDVFGLGATLLKGLTGQAPYRPPRKAEDKLRIMAGEWDRQPLEAAQVSDELKAVIQRALAADPADRFQTCDEFAAAVSRAVHPETSTFVWRLVKAGKWHLILATLVSSFVISVVLWRGSVPGTSVTASKAGLEVIVLDPPDGHRQIADSVPVHSGQLIRCVAEVPAGRAAILTSVDPEGKISVLDEFDAKEGSRQISYPRDAHKAVPLEGAGGSEIIALCVGDSISDLKIAAENFQWGPLPALENTTVFRVEKNTLVQLKRASVEKNALAALGGDTRGLGAPVAVDLGSEMAITLSKCCDHMKKNDIELHAISFAHVVSKTGR